MDYKHDKVLVIDDNEIDRYVAELVMEKTGFAKVVITVESAVKALDYLKQHDTTPDDLPDLIFLDINMPTMNGFEFLVEYEKLSDSIKKNCIIMMLTTSLNENDRKQAELSPFVYKFLNKPLDPEKLKQVEYYLHQ